jgi:hypothetical protein
MSGSYLTGNVGGGGLAVVYELDQQAAVAHRGAGACGGFAHGPPLREVAD